MYPVVPTNLEQANNLIRGKLLQGQTNSGFATELKMAQQKILKGPDSTGNTEGTGKEQRKTQLKEVSYQMETIFINMMLKEMRASIHKTELFDGGFGEEIFDDMLYEEYAKTMAKTAKFGLADQIYQQMERYL